MKRSLPILFFLFAFLLGCNTTTNVLTVSKETIEIPVIGGSSSFTIQIDADSWNIEQPAEWITLSASAGTEKETEITVRVNSKTLVDRKDTLTIKAGDAAPEQIIVSQAANDYLYDLSANRIYFNFSNLSGTQAMIITTDAPTWLLSCDADWVQISQKTGTAGTTTINITVPKNTLSEDRTVDLVLSAENAPTTTIPVTQKGAFPNYNTNPIASDATGMSSSAFELAKKIKVGWNAGNTMEAVGGETAWGNPMISDNLIKLVKQSGFNAIRLPCAWNQYADQITAKISDNWLNRVKQVVQLCVNNDMYVLLNIHWDGGWLENNCTTAKKDENNAKQKAFWQQIATKLRDFDEHLIFASANEPNVSNATQMSVLMSYHQTFIDAVRSTGGKNAYRVLVVQGPSTDITTTNSLMSQMPTDNVPNRMMAEVHYYTPWNFCGLTKDETWGKMAYYWGTAYHSTTDPAHNSTWGEEATLVDYFGLMKKKFVDKGIPVIIGEFGAVRRDNLTGDALSLHLASRAHFLKCCTKTAKIYGFLPFYWDNGCLSNASGIFNRKTNVVFDQQALDGLIQGATE